MGRPIVKYFMWPYQLHFQTSAQNAAERLFDELLPQANPRLILVGIQVDDREDRHPVCVEPDHDNIQPDCFSDLDKRAEDAVKRDERSTMCYSHPIAAERVHQRVMDDALRVAIEECCTAIPGEEDSIFFAASSARIDSHAVFAVLRLRRSAIEACHRLPDKEVDRIHVHQSLIDSVIAEFQSCVQAALHEPNAGVNLNVVKASTDELLRRGGLRFMESIGWRVFRLDGLENVHRLCESITAISAMRYEGDQAIGRLYLCQTEEIDFPAALKFRTPVSLRETRRIRKLLELAHGDYALLLADVGVVGLGRLEDSKRPKEQRFDIEISGHHHWRVFHGGEVLCEFRYGTPKLPRPKLTRAEFAELCDRVLPKSARIDDLFHLVEACVEQRHGTTLVITPRAEQEAARLSQQSTLIEPITLLPNMIRAISSIDGAVLVDPLGVCHAFGVILDGLATQHGDPGRGARFNSAIRYLEFLKGGCVACIVSEDGDVALLPQLRPRVKRQDIAATIEELRNAANETPLRPRVYAQWANKVEEYEFYLSAEQCADVNTIIERVEKKLDEEERQVKFIRRSMRPHPEMAESYFFAEAE